MTLNTNAGELKDRITGKLLRTFGQEPEQARKQEIYKAACMVVRDIMSELKLSKNNGGRVFSTNNGSNGPLINNIKNEPAINGCGKGPAVSDGGNGSSKKEVYYLSMEFLPGSSLRNNLFNLGLEAGLSDALSLMGHNLDDIYSLEPNAGLGNGGLGRLASCYLDAMATLGISGQGMSICYEYGIFKQKIVGGRQVELPDDWLDMGAVWLQSREDEIREVRFGGRLSEIWNEKGEMKLVHTDFTTVLALPRDMLIPGFDSDTINTLRLWQSASPVSIDMELFARGKYLQAMEQKHMAEVISKILYPEDAHTEGKTLRLMQQYFFISASMQTITEKHLTRYGTLDNLPEHVAVHINDTHPAMAIPELLRILLDEYGFAWDKAWEIVTATVSYTNHTVMPEALEQWPEDLFGKLLPRIHSIINEINRRQSQAALKAFPFDEDLREDMAIISGGKLFMANLCVAAAHSVNGVSGLHSRILKQDLFDGFYRMYPEKFTNVTNGIAYRRWLCQANPKLAELITELCGEGFIKDSSKLEKLMEYQNDPGVLDELERIKHSNKKRLAAYLEEQGSTAVNPDSLFDVQVKRFHEYKRQLLNLFHIMHLYTLLKENPDAQIPDRTFIFGGKAAAGYFMAKQIIRLACHLSAMIEKEPAIRERIRIVFLENYSVSLSELIMPAAEISEQISLAGKEASGTGNMKLMINGAITLGTLDGANVEIHQAVGDDNILLFGMTEEEVGKLRLSGTYSPWYLIRGNPRMERVIGLMSEKINGESFMEIINYLTAGYNGIADPYFVLGDFESYRHVQEKAGNLYRDRRRWNKMSLANIAGAGIFSADRSIREYASRIWNINL